MFYSKAEILGSQYRFVENWKSHSHFVRNKLDWQFEFQPSLGLGVRCVEADVSCHNFYLVGDRFYISSCLPATRKVEGEMESQRQ